MFWKIYEELPDEIAKSLGIPKNHNPEELLSVFLNTKYLQDKSSDANANVSQKNIVRIRQEIFIPQTKLLTFKLLYEQMKEMYNDKANDLLKKLWYGELYLHDSAHPLVPYCLGIDVANLLIDGMPYGYLPSEKPKNPHTFINQVKELIIELSNELAGAVAVPSLIICYSYIYRKKYGKNINVDLIKNDFQNLVYTINKPLRGGVQSPFTNLSFFDRYCLSEMIEYVYNWMATDLDISKENFVSYVYDIQEIIMEYLCTREVTNGKIFRFPVLTANFVCDENKEIRDKNFLDLVSKLNVNGIMNIYISDDVRKFSSCCRMLNDFTSLKFDSFANGGINLGSVKIVTINLNRIALEGKDFFEKLNENMEDAKLILDAYRKLLRKNLNLLTFFKIGWLDLDRNFFSTIGFIGLYEAMKTLNKDLNFMEEVLNFMDNKIKEFNSLGLKWKYNLEQVPGETLAVTFAEIDRYLFKDNVPYMYANQFIPLYENISTLDKILIEGRMFKYLSGGGITHLNVGEKLTPDYVKFLIEFATRKGLEHFAINPVYSICENGHHSVGKLEKCPLCGEKIVDYITRIVGYFVPVSSWNKARREWEFGKRIWNLLK